MSEQPQRNNRRLTSGPLLARNAYINLAGQILPIVVAVFAIPLLIKVLGTERFGVLALAWVVLGYFGLFDFGLSRATTKFVAEYQARGRTEAIPVLIWSSVVAHVFLGLLGGGILALLTPWLVQSLLNIPTPLLQETTVSFYLLAFSVPFIVAAAALRGVLEAIQRFDLVNLIRTPVSVINYLGPLFVLYFFRSLIAVVGFLVISRVVVLFVHLWLCLRVLPVLARGFGFSFTEMKPLLGFGGWSMASSFVSPSIASIDRFMIGAYISLSAVTLYVTPFEVITKLTIFSASLLSVLFPAFSALATNREQELRQLYLRAFKYLLVLVAPIVGVLLALVTDLLNLWVAAEFADKSAPLAKWFAVGVLINIMAYVPFTLLQGIGRADVAAKLQLAQLPLYALGVWFVVEPLSVTGVAVVWVLRAVVNAATMFAATHKLLPSRSEGTEDRFSWLSLAAVAAFLLAFFGVGLSGDAVLRVAATVVLLGVMVAWEWFGVLETVDRKAFTGAASSALRR